MPEHAPVLPLRSPTAPRPGDLVREALTIAYFDAVYCHHVFCGGEPGNRFHRSVNRLEAAMRAIGMPRPELPGFPE